MFALIAGRINCSPVIDDIVNIVNDIAPALGAFAPKLLQTGGAVVSGGGGAVSGTIYLYSNRSTVIMR